MANSFGFAKNKLSNGLKGYLISNALAQGCSILGDRGTPLPTKLKSVYVKKSVSLKISIGYRYVIYFAESVSVRLKVPKSVRIGVS